MNKKLLNAVTVFIGSIFAAVTYRLGGTSAGSKWRDAGVPAIMVTVMTITGHWHWTLILCFGLLWVACSTYNKWVGYLLNRPDKHTVYWESWLVTGLFYGFSMLPYIIYNHHYIGFGIRSVLLAISICVWSQIIGKDTFEEWGRGFLIIATLPLLFMGN